METNDIFKVGDIVKPTDGSDFRARIIYISKDTDTVRHMCLKSGAVYEKSYYGFPVRYMHID